MSQKPSTDSHDRISALRQILADGEISTQEEIAEQLNRQNFQVTQSTVSRDLRRIGAIKTFDSSGRVVYRLPDDVLIPSVPSSGLKGLILKIEHNGYMIVVHTAPGSASLVARHLDQVKPDGILGTMAGDDTIFVAPANIKKIEQSIKVILAEFN